MFDVVTVNIIIDVVLYILSVLSDIDAQISLVLMERRSYLLYSACPLFFFLHD